MVNILGSDPVATHMVESAAGGTVAIHSFVERTHYARNFAEQWSRFRDTQLDSCNGTDISRDFLVELLGEPLESLAGKRVLEVGSGAGRFTEHLVRHADHVVATDLSEAVYVNAAIGARNADFIQADLLDMPTFDAAFDVVVCRGVLQHTPDPVASVRILHSLVAPGGLLAFDIYGKAGIPRLRPKYLWRPVIQRLFTFERFVRFLDRWTEPALRFRWRAKKVLPRKVWRVLDYIVPVWDHRETLPLSEEELIEWSKLDTLDAMFAEYDIPMAPGEVIPVLIDLGFRELSVDPHKNIYRLRV